MYRNHDTSRDRRRAARSLEAAATSVVSRARSLLTREGGAALVEFALVLPILAVLLFGMLEFGKVFNYWIDETHLTAEGARWAVVNNVPSGSSLQQYILNQADSAELRSGAHVCISFPPNPSGTGSSGKVGDPVEVDMSYQAGIPVVSGLLHKVTKFFGSSTIPSSITVRGSSTMRLEAPPSYSAGNLGGSC